MATFKIKESHVRPLVSATTAVFILLAAANALAAFPHHALCLAVGALCIGSLWLTPWEITLALLFSALGDLCGSCGNLPAQMGTFAIAHILYIYFFARRYHRKVEPDGKLTARAKGFLMMMSFCILSLLALVFVKVVPAAPEGILQVGVGIYAVIICTMMLTAMLQRSMFYALGALLFAISDLALAWNMFVVPVPNADIVILRTYFGADWLLLIRASPYKVPQQIHLLRF